MKKLLMWAVVFSALLAGGARMWAQTAQDLTGTWQGSLKLPNRELRTVVKIARDDGKYKAMLYSIDQGAQGLPSAPFALEGGAIKMQIAAIGGSYSATLSPDGKTLTGTFTQGDQPLPLVLVKTPDEQAWAIPEPPKPIPPMAADAKAEFDVATVKPSNPDAKGMGFRVQGRHFDTINTTLSDILQFAYGLQAKQIVGAPDWVNTEKFDISGTPLAEGRPSDKQWKAMLVALVVERFQLKTHPDKKELACFALTVAKSGAKLTPSTGDPNGLPGIFFGGRGPITLTARNANMDDFSKLLQSSVLDRPVVDQTGLKGRFDFSFAFTPDESMLMFGKLPPPAADAPPGLLTAMPEGIGLKVESTKAMVDVRVIDHVEKPSSN